jgi:hypothetical protein
MRWIHTGQHSVLSPIYSSRLHLSMNFHAAPAFHTGRRTHSPCLTRLAAVCSTGAFPEKRIREMVSRLAAYLREEREVYVRHSEPLSADLRAWIQGYFPDELLGRLKAIILKGPRIPPPPFYAEAREMSGGRFPPSCTLRQ